ncbi:DUF6263 family protein [Corynebacterium tuscaniense]|uniref:DUF6263 family protein n=1 Tax=Corynebacterium tuscaniense TaxID=302449 RepID=UPI0012399F7F|nr:DUF6263 family protein [Corynebacterium tuscaniense]KAA8746726.1 hypothetical protein F4V54_00285 [Corynebacterium tuscaniense]
MRRITATLLVASALVVSGCSRTDPIEEIPDFAVDTPDVKLISAGEGDKEQLVYSFSPQESEITVSYAAHQGAVATDKVSVEAPAGGDVEQVTLPLSVAVVDGNVAEFTVGEPKHSNLDTGTEALTAEGFRMRWTTDVQGQIEDIKLLPPEGSSDEGRAVIERALLQIISTNPVFPVEPVGVGATWSVETRTLGETNMRRTTTYSLTSRDGNTVTLDVQVQEEPAKKTLNLDGEDNLTAEEWSTTSQGTITVDLNKLLPIAGENAATTRTVYAGPNPDFKVVQDMTTATTYKK